MSDEVVGQIQGHAEYLAHRLERLEARIEALETQAPSPAPSDSTHWEGCGVDGGHRHYACLLREYYDLRTRCERLKQEAQAHAQEAHTQRATVHECYQIATDGKGEPGDWHGAEPIRQLRAKLEAADAVVDAASECWDAYLAALYSDAPIPLAGTKRHSRARTAMGNAIENYRAAKEKR